MRIDIINGPNLNLLGEREPDIYGKTSLDEIKNQSIQYGQKHDMEVFFQQSNSEANLIDAVQIAHKKSVGMIINAAGYSHSSISLLDSLLAAPIPIIEVHLSNIFARESFRHKSLLSTAVNGVICGLGAQGYLLALDALAYIITNQAHNKGKSA